MMNYSPDDVKSWIHSTIGVNNEPGRGEIQTNCPVCGREAFYFNIYKQVGVCHKASCGYSPTLNDLIELVGFAPNKIGYYNIPEFHNTPEGIIELPGTPVAKMILGKFMTSNQTALDYLRSRGLDDEIIVNWGITCDGERVYVPIKSGGAVRNYNSRVLPGVPGKKYLYAPGGSTTKYILGWEECALWDRIALIENTFVSLALRNKINATTVFGSHLSDDQADMIAKSSVQLVAILWDEGAEEKAEKAIEKLHSRGVKAAYWMIAGQPDDHPFDWVAEKAEMVYNAALNGVNYVDCT